MNYDELLKLVQVYKTKILRLETVLIDHDIYECQKCFEYQESTVKCDGCEKRVCDDCIKNCSDCNKNYCDDDGYKKRVCDCIKHCSDCYNNYCDECEQNFHRHSCHVCEEWLCQGQTCLFWICNNCLKFCPDCGLEFCWKCGTRTCVDDQSRCRPCHLNHCGQCLEPQDYPLYQRTSKCKS